MTILSEPNQAINPFLIYAPESSEGWLEFTFKVEGEKLPKRLLLVMQQGPEQGRYEATLNGYKIGPTLDLYHPARRLWEFHLLDFWPDPGEYTLRLTCDGKHRFSEGFGLSLQSLRLRERLPEVTEYRHDKFKDWRVEPKLYQ